MAVAGGPNLSENGLVFYYDTDNGKSYKGEPTTNHAAGRAFSGNSPNVTTTTVEDTLPDGSRGTVYEMNCQIVGDANRTISVGSFDVPANTTVTLSFYVKNIDCTGFGGNLWTPTLGRGLGQITYPTVYTDRWVRVETTYLIPEEGHATVTTSPQLFRDAGIGRLRMTQPQFEYKSHATQYIDGSRSATESLYDFIGDSALDVSNVSFDSNADITFDGSNDRLNLSSAPLPAGASSYTIEAVFKPEAQKTQVVWEQNTSTLQSGRRVCMILISDGDGGFNGQSADRHDQLPYTVGNYHHWIITVDNNLSTNKIKMYANGELVDQGNPSGTLNAGADGASVGYKLSTSSEYFDGEIPLVKVYNRVLSAEEVENNFNGIRSRFGI